jgi:hypothetical protein
MTCRVRRRFIAWLGLLAMSLVVFAPTVSHFVRASRMVAVPVCIAEGAEGEHGIVPWAGGAVPRVQAMATPALAVNAFMALMGVHDMHMMDHGSGAPHGMAGHGGSGSAPPMDDCGYCDLFHHIPAMPTVPPAPVAAVLLLFVAFVLPALARHTPLGAFPSGRPRAPPAIS